MNFSIRIFQKITAFLIMCSFGATHLEAQIVAQNYGVQKISTEIQRSQSGISQNSVRCIFRDHKGFLWIGTWDGLNRYDGIRFLVMRDEIDENSKSLTNSTVNAIKQDKSHSLWIGTEEGLNCLNYASMTRQSFGLKQSYPLLEDTIHAIYVDKQDRVWVGSQNGLGVINASRDSVKLVSELIDAPTELDSAEIRQISHFYGNQFWVGSNQGLYLVDLELKQVKKWGDGLISDRHITCLSNFKDSILLIGTENGYNILHLSDHRLTQHYMGEDKRENLGENVFLSSYVFTDSTVLLGNSGQGLKLFDFKAHKFYDYALPNLGSQDMDVRIQTDNVMSIAEDSYDNLWLGTAWDGLICLSPEPVLFKTFRKESIADRGLSDNRIWCFQNDGNELWVGTEKGITIYDFDSHRMRYIRRNEGLSSNSVRSLFKDSKDRYWVGTYRNGLNIISQDGSITNYYAEDKNPIIPSNTVWHINEDSEGYIWVSTYNGLAKIQMDSLSAEFFQNTSDDSTSLSSNTVYSTHFDRKGRMWVSTYRGLNLYLGKEQGFKTYFKKAKHASGLSTDKIFKSYDDGEGKLWIATMGGGLNQMDLETGEIKWFTTHEGLPNNVIYSLVDDGMGALWLSTNSGICRFDKADFSTHSYSVADGLQSSEFNFGADLIDEHKNIYMGGMKGFNVFNPKAIHASIKSAPLSVSWIKTLSSDKRYDFEFGDTLVLKPNDNFFDVAYTQLNFKEAVNSVFKHRLLHYDPNWIADGQSVFMASYANLPSGIYQFQLQSESSQEKGIGIYSFTVIVEQVWYKTVWFRLSILLMTILFMGLLIRLRIHRIKYKAEVRNQLHQLEKQALRLQMNPHFVFNTLNSIQSYILNNNTSESIAYLSKFSKLMRNILNNSGEPIVTLVDEIEMLKQYLELEQLRFNHCFDYEFKVDNNVDVDFVGIPGMLLQPYVENAIIHGVAPLNSRQGKISIQFSYLQDQLQCIIEDNGVGRGYHQKKSGRLHKPKGMLISQKRLQILNKDAETSVPIRIHDLVDEAGNTFGTKIVLITDVEKLND